jgi:hypothetical protein
MPVRVVDNGAGGAQGAAPAPNRVGLNRIDPDQAAMAATAMAATDDGRVGYRPAGRA